MQIHVIMQISPKINRHKVHLDRPTYHSLPMLEWRDIDLGEIS